MASVLLPRKPITNYEAEWQFDLLFDEYFKEQGPVADGNYGGQDRLESGSAEESDEVHIAEEHLGPQQVNQRQAICEVAQSLRSLGDQYTQQYRQDIVRADTTLTALFTHATSLEYDTFKNTMEGLTPHDRNAANLVFMMVVGKHVVSNVGNLGNKAKNYFKRLIGGNYIPEVAEAGGVKEYVEEKS